MNNFEKLKEYRNIQMSEANLHWKRNNIFLIVFSFLILAGSQFDNKAIFLTISCFGIILSIAWILIQYRSSQYINFWKEESRKIHKANQDLPNFYPKDLSGIEMRYIVFILPIMFMVLFILLTIFGAIYTFDKTNGQ